MLQMGTWELDLTMGANLYIMYIWKFTPACHESGSSNNFIKEMSQGPKTQRVSTELIIFIPNYTVLLRENSTLHLKNRVSSLALEDNCI